MLAVEGRLPGVRGAGHAERVEEGRGRGEVRHAIFGIHGAPHGHDKAAGLMVQQHRQRGRSAGAAVLPCGPDQRRKLRVVQSTAIGDRPVQCGLVRSTALVPHGYARPGRPAAPQGAADRAASIPRREDRGVGVDRCGEDLECQAVDADGHMHVVVDLNQRSAVELVRVRGKSPMRCAGGAADERGPLVGLEHVRRELLHRLPGAGRAPDVQISRIAGVGVVAVENALPLVRRHELAAEEDVRWDGDVRGALPYNELHHLDQLLRHFAPHAHGVQGARHSRGGDHLHGALGDGHRAEEACGGDDDDQPDEDDELHEEDDPPTPLDLAPTRELHAAAPQVGLSLPCVLDVFSGPLADH
mmetsp:Transcript_110796/g.320203  ORF Transcript_110796/g.320203 Transcript_110796/m.320203 type:complete len:357 (-) Transcript_110796:404-1474(-)